MTLPTLGLPRKGSRWSAARRTPGQIRGAVRAIGIRGWSKWAEQPFRPPQATRTRPGPGELEPFPVDLARSTGVDADVAVLVCREGWSDGHLLMPGVGAGDRGRVDREGQVLMDARVTPPHPRRIRIPGRGWRDALPPPHPPLASLSVAYALVLGRGWGLLR